MGLHKLRETRIRLRTALALCVLSAAAMRLLCGLELHWRTSSVSDKLREIDRIAASQYVGEWDAQTVGDRAAQGYVAGLGDRWSYYIPADQYDAFCMEVEGQGCGIGVTVQRTADSIRVSLVYDDSPAAAAGIRKGDYIVGADGLTVEQDGTEAVVDAIRGEAGTEVAVSVRADGADTVRTLTLTRAVVTQKIAWSARLTDTVGYIRLESFHVGAAAQFGAALDALLADGVQALVIDVRHNGGGRVKEMSDALDRLLPAGTIVTLRPKHGRETVYTSDDDMIDLPLAVLIDEQSISAAELFAAVLQEHGRATLVGAHTTGKGRAQRTFELSDGSAINLSVEEYFTPHGRSLAGVGIAPDLACSLSDEQQQAFFFLSPENDPQLQKALHAVQQATAQGRKAAEK